MGERKELPAVESCSTCRFWIEYDEQPEIASSNPDWVRGACRRGLRMVQRHIKLAKDLELFDSWAWPAHDAGDWCGEWEGRK